MTRFALVIPIAALSAGCLLSQDGGGSGGPSPTSTPIAGTVPTVSIVASDIEGNAPFEVELAAEVTGGDGEVLLQWDLGDGNQASEPVVVHTYETPGLYTVQVTATDRDGDEGSAATELTVRVFEVDVVASANLTLGTAPLVVDFAATIEGVMEPYIVSWDFGDGSTENTANPQYTYTQPGRYVAHITVTDTLGRVGEANLPIRVAAPTLMGTEALALPEVGDTGVSFTSLVVGGEGTLEYQWRFGDGATSSEANPHHAYEQSGAYDARLRVEDGYGQVSIATVSFFAGIPSQAGADLRVVRFAKTTLQMPVDAQEPNDVQADATEVLGQGEYDAEGTNTPKRVLYYADIVNAGIMASGVSTVDIYVEPGSEPLPGSRGELQRTVPALKSGQVHRVYALLPDVYGPIESWAQVDAFDRVSESAEENNVSPPLTLVGPHRFDYDWFSFIVPGSRVFELRLHGMNANFDLEVYDEAGLLEVSNGEGLVDEIVSLPAQTFGYSAWARVVPTELSAGEYKLHTRIGVQ